MTKKSAPEWWQSVPKRIKVLYRTMDVELMDEAKTFDTGAVGQCNTLQGRIALCRWLDPQEAADTLVHELWHSVWRFMGLGKESPEEDMASRMATGMSTVIRDNPGLMQWIERNLNNKKG